MEQNGNNGSPPDKMEGMLKKFADMRRAQTRAEDEARKLGKPLPTSHQPMVLESAPFKSSEDIVTPSKTPKEEDVILTSTEAAKLLGYAPKSFMNAVSAGKIPHYKLFGQNRFKKQELLNLLVKVEVK